MANFLEGEGHDFNFLVFVHVLLKFKLLGIGNEVEQFVFLIIVEKVLRGETGFMMKT